MRSTISAQPINQQYLALHEIATAGSEQLIFDNIALVRDDKPGSINPGDLKAAHLIASDPHKRIGTAIMLRVMPGDKFTFGADSYYESDQTETNETPSGEDVVNSLLTALTGGTVGGIPVTDAGENVSMINQALSNQETIDFIKTQMELQQNTNGPKAALNYLFFDQGFKLMPAISGKLGVTVTPGQFNNMSVSPTPMTEPGYVVVFVDNNSIGTDVWFDNVQVSHYSGQVLEEDHYYPFGLTISESSNNPAIPNQPFKYNGKELEKPFGLETYEYGARQYDPQIGKWKGIDPLADRYLSISPFAYVANNPIMYIDPDGRKINPANQKEWDKQKTNIENRRGDLVNNINSLTQKGQKEGWSQKKLERKIGDMNDRVKSLDNTLATMKVLEDPNNSQQYSLHTIKSIDVGGIKYDNKTGDIVFSYGSTAQFIHEGVVHAGQFESGDLGFSKLSGMPVAQDLEDEVAAYKAQYAYDPTSTGRMDFTTINSQWVQTIKDASGTYLYDNHGILPVNVNSTFQHLMNAYPNQTNFINQINSLSPADRAIELNYKVKDDPDVLFK
ncbi:hypothetical protein D3C86_1033810 [compost metagenome]